MQGTVNDNSCSNHNNNTCSNHNNNSCSNLNNNSSTSHAVPIRCDDMPTGSQLDYSMYDQK